jgi:hypothetical protein
MKKIKFIPVFLLVLSACTPQVKWVENVEQNNLSVSAGKSLVGRYILVENTSRTWNGSFKGGKEKWNYRKQLMFDVGKKELPNLCQGDYTLEEPSYVMEERDASAYGGGALGYIISAAIASDENIPTKMHLSYKCSEKRMQ